MLIQEKDDFKKGKILIDKFEHKVRPEDFGESKVYINYKSNKIFQPLKLQKMRQDLYIQ